MKKYFLLLSIGFVVFLQIEFKAFSSYPYMRYAGDLSSTDRPLRPMVLTGPEAFYNSPDYELVTKRDLEAAEPLAPSGVFKFESQPACFAKDVFSCILFPWGIFRSLHTMYGSQFFQSEQSTKIATQARSHINLNSEWKYRRFTLLVDGMPVDAIVMGRPSTFGNNRWMLLSIGITKIYECLLIDNPEAFHPGHPPGLAPLQQLLKQINANLVVYNYPGMGDAGGVVNKTSMQKAHEAFLQFIEQKFQAKEIVDYGHSFGGANQADTWSTHTADPNIRYVLVKDRSPTYVSDAVKNLAGLRMEISNIILGWQINTVSTSNELKHPEIHVMSVKNIKHPMVFTDAAQVAESEINPFTPTYHDSLIPYKASTAMYYLRQLERTYRKVIIGVPDDHGATITEPTLIAQTINEAFGEASEWLLARAK